MNIQLARCRGRRVFVSPPATSVDGGVRGCKDDGSHGRSGRVFAFGGAEQGKLGYDDRNGTCRASRLERGG